MCSLLRLNKETLCLLVLALILQTTVLFTGYLVPDFFFHFCAAFFCVISLFKWPPKCCLCPEAQKSCGVAYREKYVC